jgi:hypothetical protein
MQASDLNSSLPKPWLNINANSLEANSVIGVDSVTSSLLTLQNQSSVPNAPINSINFFSNSSGVLSGTNQFGATVVYSTSPSSGGYVVGTAPSVVGNFASFGNTGATGVYDSGFNAASITSKLPLAGGTMSGPINMNNNNITGISQLLLNSSSGDVVLGSTFTNNEPNQNHVLIGNSITVLTNSSHHSNSVALGLNVSVGGQDPIALGNGSTAGATSSATDYCIAIGSGANANIEQAIAIGKNASSSGAGQAIAIGNNAITSAGSAIAIGNTASASSLEAIAIGYNANNSLSNSCLIGDPAIVNIRSNNSSNACDLGSTASPFKTCWLRDSAPATGCRFSMYGPVTVSNTTVDTSVTTGTSVGSLVASATQQLGTLYRLKGSFTYSGNGTDTNTLNFKINGTTVLTQNINAIGIVGRNFNMVVEVMVISSSHCSCSMVNLFDSSSLLVAQATPSFNPTVANTFDLSVQWSGASSSDSIVANYLYMEDVYAR